MKQMTGYMHGIDLGGWLSQCDHTKETYDSFIVESDIAKIKEWGLDHVRLPIDYELVEDKDGSYIEEGFGYIDKAIEWCRKYGLNMVLDLHKTFGFSFDDGYNENGFFDSEQYQERFYKLWEEFSGRYGKNSDMLCFELLNEVTDKGYCDIWNEVSLKCIKRIRAIAPDIKILIGGYYNNSVEALKDLSAPYDSNIVYNFHCYEPLVFTHQGAPWIPEMDTSFRMDLDCTYADYIRFSNEQLGREITSLESFDPDERFSTEFFERWLSEAVRVAEERDVALYCGEYGVIDRVAPEAALEWYRTICTTFDKFGIGRAAWNYKKMDFGIADERMDAVRDELLKLL